MRFFNYSEEKQERSSKASTSLGPEFYITPITLSKEEKARILSEIADYVVRVWDEDEVEWYCDSSRNSSSLSTSYIDVPDSTIILKDGHFWGYRIKTESHSGNCVSERKESGYTIICIDDDYSVEIKYYCADTDDYEHTSTVSHRLIKRSEVPDKK